MNDGRFVVVLSSLVDIYRSLVGRPVPGATQFPYIQFHWVDRCHAYGIHAALWSISEILIYSLLLFVVLVTMGCPGAAAVVCCAYGQAPPATIYIHNVTPNHLYTVKMIYLFDLHRYNNRYHTIYYVNNNTSSGGNNNKMSTNDDDDDIGATFHANNLVFALSGGHARRMAESVRSGMDGAIVN